MKIHTVIPTQIDAIIVPTIRSADWLTDAANLARKTGAYLLVLCSGGSRAAEVTGLLGQDVRAIVLDIPLQYTHELLTGFATDTFREAQFGAHIWAAGGLAEDIFSRRRHYGH